MKVKLQNMTHLNTAEYGEYVSGKRIVDSKTKENEKFLKISIWKIYKTMDDEHKSGQKLPKNEARFSKHPIEKVERVYTLMPWIGKNKLVDKDKINLIESKTLSWFIII